MLSFNLIQIHMEDENGVIVIANQADIQQWERKEIFAKNCIFFHHWQRYEAESIYTRPNVCTDDG